MSPSRLQGGSNHFQSVEIESSLCKAFQMNRNESKVAQISLNWPQRARKSHIGSYKDPVPKSVVTYE